jgi:hypothetical protein
LLKSQTVKQSMLSAAFHCSAKTPQDARRASLNHLCQSISQPSSTKSPKNDQLKPIQMSDMYSFCGTVGWTQGFIFVRQALYHVSHYTSPLSHWLFLILRSHFMPQLACHNPPICAYPFSWNARHMPLPAQGCWNWVLWTFCPDWTWNLIPSS